MIIMGERWSLGAAIAPRFFSARRRLIVAAGLVASASCKGSIEGSVFGTDSPQAVRLSGQAVFLLAASPDVGSALKTVCPANAPGWSEAVRAERERFGALAATYGDSARDELALRRGSRRWTSLDPDHEHVSRLRCIDEWSAAADPRRSRRETVDESSEYELGWPLRVSAASAGDVPRRDRAARRIPVGSGRSETLDGGRRRHASRFADDVRRGSRSLTELAECRRAPRSSGRLQPF